MRFNHNGQNNVTARVAQTKDERDGAFRLRFEVYCQECGYLDPRRYPDGLERDAFDDHAVHALAVDPTGAVAGAVRLVLPSPLGLPTQDYFPRWNGGDISHLAEVSRLIVAPPYRGASQPILLTLAATLYQESVRRGVSGWLCTMFVPTWRLFRRMGIPFRLAGDLSMWPPASEHVVIPSSFDFVEAALYLKGCRPELYRLMAPHDAPCLSEDEQTALGYLCSTLTDEERILRQSLAAQRSRLSQSLIQTHP
jgi:N-acyl-L-homoserine lactone synthetase